jgi:cytochrome c peroxidase
MLRALGCSLLSMTAVVAQVYFPPPPEPANNPATPDKVLLGMALFFEEQLSSTSTVACATCHDLAHGGIDARTVHSVNPGPDGVYATDDDQHGSPGVVAIAANGTVSPHSVHGFGPRVTSRRAPTVVNSGYQPNLLYDGSKTSLEQLVAGPILNAVEMSHAGRTWNDVTTKLAAAKPLVFASNLPARLQGFLGNHSYPDLFYVTYGSTGITQERIVNAIAVYLRTLNSDGSKYDRFLNNQAALTPQELLGLQLFRSPANGATSCSTCHSDFEASVLQEGPIVGAMTTVTSGYYGAPISTRLLFHNIGIRPNAEDPGRQSVTNLQTDAGKFRVASLRNLELTAPYFHNGSAMTLHDVLDFYDRGGDYHVNQAPSLTVRNYTATEKAAIFALLMTLTDTRLVTGVQPFDRPLLGSQNGRLVTPIGDGMQTSGGYLTAHAPFAPRVGESWFRITLNGATVGSPAFLMFDVAASPGGPFNLELAMTPALQIFGIGVAQAASTSGANGVVQAPLPLPNVPSLSGALLFTQWLVLEPSAGSFQFATSNALRIPLL